MIALPENITCIADAKVGYDAEPKGFVQVPRALRQRCKKLSAGEWAVLVEVLDRGYSWGRYEPQKIKIEDFCESSGLTKRAIDNGISGLTARGVLYEERTGTSKTSASRYAIIAASNPESGPYTTPEGTLAIVLLGGLIYPVNPVFLKSRKTNSNPTKQENVFLQSRKSNPTKQENTQSRQVAQQEAPQANTARPKKVMEEGNQEGPVVTPPPFKQNEGKGSDSQGQPSSTGVWLSEENTSGRQDIFGQPLPVAPSKPSRSKPKKGLQADDPLVVAWLAAINRKVKPTAGELRDWEPHFNDMKTGDPPVTPEEMPRLMAYYRSLRDKTGKPYNHRHPRSIARNFVNLREEMGASSSPPSEPVRVPSLAADGRDLNRLLFGTNPDERPSGQSMFPRGS